MKSFIFVFAFIAASVASGRELQTLRFSSGGTCVAHANTKVEKAAHNGFAKAVAEAYAIGCGSDYSGDKLVVELVKKYDASAKALVNIWTSAFSLCTTYGKAFGCASAFAHAKGKTDAIISLISEATAKAKNACKSCDPDAVAVNWAKLVVKLFAQAEAKVITKVCVGPNESASADAFAACHAKTIAHGIARAHAYALIEGGCVPGKDKGSKLQATALTDVENTVDVDPDCFCTGWLKVCDGKKCDWKKSDASNTISKEAASKCPLTYAHYKAECAAYAKQLE